MPSTSRRMKEGVSTKMTSTTIHPRRVTSGTAGPLLYDGVGAVGGGTDHWLTAHLATLTAEENTRMNIGQIDGEISGLYNIIMVLPTNFTFFMSGFPSVTIFKE